MPGGPEVILPAIASTVLGKVMAPKVPEPAAPPPPPTPTVMPVTDDEAARKAQRRRAADISMRGGRVSTILTEQSAGKLGA